MSFIVNSSLKNGVFSFIRKVAPATTVYCDTGSIRAKDLESVLTRKVDCLVVEGFLQKQALETAQRLASGYHKDMLHLPKEYVYSGFSAEETMNNPTLKHFYHSSAVQSLSKLREESAPALTWIDKIRLELDEQYKKGARLFTFEGQKHQAYISRAIGIDDKPLIQVRDLPTYFKPTTLKTQLIALQFLVAPEKGGHLELYPDLIDEQERQLIFDKRLDILPSTLPQPSEVIKAYPGRLVLLNSQIPFRFSLVESRELDKEESKKYLTPEEIKKEKTVTKNISLVAMESFILQQTDQAPLSIMR